MSPTFIHVLFDFAAWLSAAGITLAIGRWRPLAFPVAASLRMDYVALALLVSKENPARVLAVLFGILLMLPGLGALGAVAAFGLEQDFVPLWAICFAISFAGILLFAFRGAAGAGAAGIGAPVRAPELSRPEPAPRGRGPGEDHQKWRGASPIGGGWGRGRPGSPASTNGGHHARARLPRRPTHGFVIAARLPSRRNAGARRMTIP